MKQLWSVKGAVLFTDIKNFTLKSSLLTQVQVEKLINTQNDIIFPIIKKYFWNIIKSLGDSYMVVFEKAENAVYASIDIQNELLKYNSGIKFNLYTIELRITIDYWILDRKSNIKWEDYLWEPVNIASRLQSRTPESKIFITWELYNEIKWNKDIFTNYLGKTSFKWILHEIGIYDIIYLEKDIKSLKNTKNSSKKIDDFFVTIDMKKSIENIDNSIFKFASVAAILGIQPIPFLDIYALLPLHLYLLKQISKEYWIKLSKDEAKEIISTIMWSVTWSYLLSQWVVWISKIGLLWIWGYLMVPLNFALTYSIWKVLSYYLYKKSQWIKSTNSELNTLFKYSITSWKSIAKKDKEKILTVWKKYKNDFLKIIKENKINFDFIKRKK